MAGPANSWVSQYVDQPVPCTNPTTMQPSLTTCVWWLVAGLLIGSLRFSKKGQQQ